MGFTLLYLIRSFRCSIFKVRFCRMNRLKWVPPALLIRRDGGHKWIRTTDLTLIRRAL